MLLQLIQQNNDASLDRPSRTRVVTSQPSSVTMTSSSYVAPPMPGAEMRLSTARHMPGRISVRVSGSR